MADPGVGSLMYTCHYIVDCELAHLAGGKDESGEESAE
jgi:hypothetical protein